MMAALPDAPLLIPVIDVMAGMVVHARGGNREQYQPLRSKLTNSVSPRTVASVLMHAAQATECYVADLDGIMGRVPVSAAVLAMLAEGIGPVWLDVGLSARKPISVLPTGLSIRPVIGFETCDSLEVLRTSLNAWTESPLAFSLDLRNGQLVGNVNGWRVAGKQDAVGVATQVIEAGVRTLIVLDLARVGETSGCGSEELIATLHCKFPEVALIAGGGIRNWADVVCLGHAGASAVLVATALHTNAIRLPQPVS